MLSWCRDCGSEGIVGACIEAMMDDRAAAIVRAVGQVSGGNEHFIGKDPRQSRHSGSNCSSKSSDAQLRFPDCGPIMVGMLVGRSEAKARMRWRPTTTPYWEAALDGVSIRNKLFQLGWTRNDYMRLF